MFMFSMLFYWSSLSFGNTELSNTNNCVHSHKNTHIVHTKYHINKSLGRWIFLDVVFGRYFKLTGFAWAPIFDRNVQWSPLTCTHTNYSKSFAPVWTVTKFSHHKFPHQFRLETLLNERQKDRNAARERREFSPYCISKSQPQTTKDLLLI